MADSSRNRTRFPTLTFQLYQLASGAATSADLVGESLQAIEASQTTLNAFRVVLNEQATADAMAADRKREAGQDISRFPLLGIPIAVKDDVDVAGVPTTRAPGAATASASGISVASRPRSPRRSSPVMMRPVAESAGAMIADTARR